MRSAQHTGRHEAIAVSLRLVVHRKKVAAAQQGSATDEARA